MWDFQKVINACGPKPLITEGQNVTRHYSENFSRETALWMQELSKNFTLGDRYLNPEGKVNTVYGVGNQGKSLDVAALDERGYLVSNISIKSFHFKDRRTNNYRKNYTGRFYELLGEAFDVCKSYKYAAMTAIVILPDDSAIDSDPSSFALACKQFSKILRQNEAFEFGFDLVYVGTYTPKDILFFDASRRPPAYGLGNPSQLLSVSNVFEVIKDLCVSRRPYVAKEPLPKFEPFLFQ